MSEFPARSISICTTLACAFALVGFSAGCASDEPPALHERVAAAGEAHSELAARIEDAARAKNKAEDDVRAAKKAIKKAQKDLDEANEELDEANQRVIDTRQSLAEAEAEARRRGFEPVVAPTN